MSSDLTASYCEALGLSMCPSFFCNAARSRINALEICVPFLERAEYIRLCY